MTSFSHEKTLTTTRVDKDLIGRFESYFRSLLEVSGLEAKHFTSVYRLTLTDALGSESLTTIDDHLPAQLPDSTSRVDLRYDTKAIRDSGVLPVPQVEVRLSFAREEIPSRISIEVTGGNARDVVVGAKDAIDRLLEPHKTTHHLFFPGPAATAIVVLLSLGLDVTAAIVILAMKQWWVGGWLLAGSGLVLLYLTSRRWRSWTTFDSRLDRHNDEVWKVIRNGAIVFLVFGSLLTLLRQRLFHF